MQDLGMHVKNEQRFRVQDFEDSVRLLRLWRRKMMHNAMELHCQPPHPTGVRTEKLDASHEELMFALQSANVLQLQTGQLQALLPLKKQLDHHDPIINLVLVVESLPVGLFQELSPTSTEQDSIN